MFKTTKNFAENNISTPKNKKPSFDGSSFCPDFKKISAIIVTQKKLYIEPEMHYVAVLHDIILAFDVDFAGVAAGGF